MRIFNQDKTIELTNPDLSLGYLLADKILIAHHDAVEPKVIKSVKEIVEEYKAQGKKVNLRYNGKWYVTTIVYEDGGNEEEEIKDIVEEGKDAYDDYEDIKVYIPYTGKELAEHKIAELKQNLFNTDYQAIKYAEGFINELDYQEIKQQRQQWRDEINQLELLLENAK